MTGECERVRRLLGPFVDGRLQPAVRSAIVLHLRECLECIEEVRALKRLAAFATAAEPAERLRPDFAARVRAAVLRRNPGAFSTPRPLLWWRRLPFWARSAVGAAAAALLLLGVFRAGYSVGSERTPATGRWTARAPEFEPERFTRAAQVLLADVAYLDRVAEPLRQPLLAAKLDRFDLPRQAHACLARPALPASRAFVDLAEFVIQVDVALAAAGADLLDLRQLALDRGLVAVEPPAAAAVDGDFEPELLPAQRPAPRPEVAEALDLAERWVDDPRQRSLDDLMRSLFEDSSLFGAAGTQGPRMSVKVFAISGSVRVTSGTLRYGGDAAPGSGASK